MFKKSLLCAGLLLAAFASTSAFADTFTYSFTGTSGADPSPNQFAGDLTFTATQQPSGVYLITGISGFIDEGSNVGTGADNVAVDTLFAPNGFSSHHNDNLFYYPTNPSINNGHAFDGKGVAFTLVDGSEIVLYNNDGFDQWTVISPKGGSSEQSVSEGIKTVAISSVPEPGSLALLGTGVLGLAGVIRRKLAV